MPRVMIVEDDKDLADLLALALRWEKFEVIETHNGLDAYNRLTACDRKAVPDAILLDIMMPEMDGYTFQQNLEECPELRRIPIIVVSGKGQMRDIFRVAPNVFAFIDKPFETAKLINTVKKAVASSSAPRPVRMP